MKTLESVIATRISQLDKYKADKGKAVKKAEDFPQTVKDSLIVEMTMPDELKKEAKDYRKTESAIELAYLPDFKDKFRKEDKSVDKSAVRAEVHRLCDIVINSADPLTDEIIKEVQPLFDAIGKRLEKQAKNFDIQIGDAEKDILLYRLIEATEHNPVHPAGFTEFKDKLLKDDPPKKPAGFTVDTTWKLSQLEAHFNGDWGKIGKCLKDSGLKPGANDTLVQA